VSWLSSPRRTGCRARTGCVSRLVRRRPDEPRPPP
jgi:hypothetical protein